MPLIDADSDMSEDSLTKAKNEQLELQKEIAKLEKANMSAEERQAYDEAEAAIEAAKAKHAEAKAAGNMRKFVEWVNETYVPAAKRKPLPKQEEAKGGDAKATKKGDVKFGRWVVANVSKWIHQDKFVGKPKAKLIEMGEISVLVNDVVNKLKGID